MKTPSRAFLKNSLKAGSALTASFPFVSRGADVALEPIRIALIGCDPVCTTAQGMNAASCAREAAPNVQIVALAGVFDDHVRIVKQRFSDLPDRSCFSGFDSAQKALAIPEVNCALLAGPPGFRPGQLRAAVEAGKHVFMARPVAVDAPGVRSVIESGEIARKKGLSIVTGFQRRHQPSYQETIKRLQDGAIGEIVLLRAYWNQGSIWHIPEDESRSEMQRALTNWYQYRWLSGDHIVEQHVQNLDICNWAMGNQHPVRAYGQGGRQHLGNKPGHIWDHFVVEYEYANGARLFSQCRQITGTDGRVAEFAHGIKGWSNCENWIKAREGTWRYSGRPQNAYVLQHKHLINAIRSGQPVNDAKTVAESTLTAIMGRESAYSGRVIEWDQLYNSNVSLFPEKLELGPIPKFDVPVPGRYSPFDELI